MIERHTRGPLGAGRLRALAFGATATLTLNGLASEPLVPSGTVFYSTAPAPDDHDGPSPEAKAAEGPPAPTETPARLVEPPPRVASTAPDRAQPLLAKPKPAEPTPPPATAAEDPIAQALRMIAECKERYTHVRDFTCTFQKRERVGGRLTTPHVMAMKLRAQPFSVYMKFAQPNAGREAIYIAGRNGGKVLAHDVGIGKVLAGTMHLDPKGSMAMEDNLHPITDAGIGHLIDTVHKHWNAEMTPGETKVVIQPEARVGDRSCTMIESLHPQKHPNYLFHMVKVYIDRELGVPIRFEAYDWPRRPGDKPELVEEYTYANLKVNVGLREDDFDPKNKVYAYGRF